MVVMVVLLLWIKIFADATLCVIASLEHYQCFLRKDVFPIFVLGSISRNAVPGAVLCTPWGAGIALSQKPYLAEGP